MVKVRFAPSPTGYIHIGNTRIALFNWLYAQQNNGKFVLRYDDTDQERSEQRYIDAIAEDIDWLGIKPDQVEYQSKRFSSYDKIVEGLKEKGLLYPCYETPEELERRRKIRLSRKLPPVYGREALQMSDEQRKAYEAEGRKPHWRFLLPNFESSPFETRRSEVQWNDLVRGPQTIDLASMSDPVLVRGDGTYLYTLPSVVDDMDMEITHIIRGDDHVTNTGVQIAIFEALGGKVPTFGHINLLTTSSGEGLSKRKGALSIRGLHEDGFEPMAVASLATLIGTSENVIAYPTMEVLAQHFDLTATSKSAAKFDPADLGNLNRPLVHGYSYEDVAERLERLGIYGEKAKDFWTIIQGNIDKVNDTVHWWPIVSDADQSFISLLNSEDQEFIAVAAALLPSAPFNQESWKNWTSVLKEKTGRKGKELFMPLRVALTGHQHGPEMAGLLVLIGHEVVLKRLAAG